MKSLTAIIFPETIPTEESLAPLVTVFPTIVYCQPVEPAEPASDPANAACLFHFPAPLGEDLPRFHAFLRDLRQRQADYSGQLSHLAFTGLGTGPAGESRSSILSGVLHRRELTPDEKKAQLLWQARVVLKLGELFDAEQESIERDLQRLAAKHHDLFSELRQDNQIPFSLTEQLTLLPQKDKGQQAVRLKAWARLLALGTPPENETAVFLTGNAEAAEKLRESYERQTNRAPVELVTIALPARAGDNERREKFQREAAPFLETLTGIVSQATAPATQVSSPLTDPHGRWADLLEEFFPTATHGRCRLTLFSLPETSAARLFLQAFAGEEEGLDIPDTPTGRPPLVIGLLHL